MASVVVDGITKVFGTVVAVNNVSLAVNDKEFLVLVGPSGCGKTTVLRVIAGLERQDAGNIYIGDTLVNDIPPKDRDIAMVFQSYALYPHMNVYDNMAFSLTMRRVPKDQIERQVHQAAEILDIAHLLKRKPRELSGGQRQRVALGRAIVRQPKVFLMDEPLSNLDAKLRVQTRAELSKLHRRLGATFIYVTHDQTEAITLGQRIAVLNEGVLQQVDTPQALYLAPANSFVAGFIGSPPMNFFRGQLRGSKEDMYLDSSATTIRLPAEKAAFLGDCLGSEVLVGIRPEDVLDVRFLGGPEGDGCFQTEVEVVENMGSEIILYLDSPLGPLVARVDQRTQVQPGAQLTMALDPTRLYFFDPATQRSLTWGLPNSDPDSPITGGWT